MGKYAYVLICCFFITFNLPFMACSNSSEDITAYDYLAEGNHLMTQQSYEQAIDAFSKAIELEPKLDMAFSYRGFAYILIGEYDLGIADCAKAIELNPEDPIAYRNKAYGHLNTGEYLVAIDLLTEAIDLNPDFAIAYENRGFAYMMEDMLSLSIADYTQLICLQPDNFEAYRLRAIGYLELGRYDDAIDDCNRAIKIAPNYAETYYVRAMAYEYKEVLSLAIRDLETVIALTDDPILKGNATKAKDEVTEKQGNRNEHIDFGEFKSGIYTHDYFGFKITIPNFWHVMDEEERLAQVQPKGEYISDPGKLGRLLLVWADKFPPDVQVEFNPCIMIAAQKLELTPFIETGKDMHLQTKHAFDMSGRTVSYPRDIYNETIGGTLFASLEFVDFTGELPVLQKQYATVMKEYVFMISLAYSNEEELHELENILETVSFD